MLSTIPMSVAFICAAEEARVSRAAALRQRHFVPDDGGQVPVRLTPPISWTIWLAQLADGRALVQADTRIDVGYEVSLPSPGGRLLASPRRSWPRSTAPPGRPRESG